MLSKVTKACTALFCSCLEEERMTCREGKRRLELGVWLVVVPGMHVW